MVKIMKKASSLKGKQQKVTKKKEVKATRGRTLLSGQHAPLSGCCISTSLKGEPCRGPLPFHKGDLKDMVPYCEKCRKNGDPSLLVTDHPKFGKILVSRRDLPKGYRLAWWGDLTTSKKLPDAHWEWALETRVKGGIINARRYMKGSLPQFCACPGPHEKVTVKMGPNDSSNLDNSKLTCLMFSTNMPVPKNHQLCMMYSDSWKDTDEFFAERGIKRCDVGTKKYPCIRKEQFA